MAGLAPLGQPFGGPSQVINVPAPAPSPFGQAIERGAGLIGEPIGLRGQQQQEARDQQKFSQALGMLQQGQGSPEAMSGALGVLGGVESPAFKGFVRQLHADIIAREMDPQGRRQREADIELTEARRQELRAPKPTASDKKFYTDRGYSPKEAKMILDSKFGLKPIKAPRTSKDISMDLSRWQTIYSKTREVGVLGQFGDIFDPDTAKLAEDNIARLRDELGVAVAAAPSPQAPPVPEITRPFPPTGKPPAKRPPSADRVKMRNPKGAVFQVPRKDIEKWKKRGFTLIDENGFIKDKRGWIKFTAPDGTAVWVNPKDTKTAIGRGYRPSK